jgi:hypothetical protein
MEVFARGDDHHLGRQLSRPVAGKGVNTHAAIMCIYTSTPDTASTPIIVAIGLLLSHARI